MKRCIYCPGDAGKAKKQYHVALQAAGNTSAYLWPLDEVLLFDGLACDDCNEYFGAKVEPAIANHPYVQQYRAVYSIRSKKGRPCCTDDGVEVSTRQSGLLVLRGVGVELTADGRFKVPQPSVNNVDHLQVSRAVHKIALEYQILEIAKRESLEAARRAAQEPPLSVIARYIRYGHHSSYRPYGVEPQGATRVSIVPWRLESDPNGVLVSPPTFTGYVIGLPGARFSCTLAEDPSLLGYMLERIERTAARNYLTTRKVFWEWDSGGSVIV